jgi:DNA-directed RNA polymerase specialized sigma24 family protein
MNRLGGICASDKMVDLIRDRGMQEDRDTAVKVGSEALPPVARVRQKWTLTPEAFDGLLKSLDPDRDNAAERYLEIRRNLVRLLEWRGCSTPDEYADEAINRCARKIAEGEQIRDVATYSIGVARMLFREMSRERAKSPLSLDEAPEPQVCPTEPGSDPERRMNCLRRCLAELSPENRNLILHYYQGDKGEKIKNRRGLTQLFGIPASTLRMRALRLREGLHLCVENCLRQEGEN